MAEVFIDGRRYVPADEPGVMAEPDMPQWDGWIPAVGQTVWANMDSGPPVGVVIGYLNHPGKGRHGQPVIEYRGEDETGLFARKKGSRSICHPAFLWPFEPGSSEHKEAVEQGRFR